MTRRFSRRHPRFGYLKAGVGAHAALRDLGRIQFCAIAAVKGCA
jgi:hypothetical protein